MATRLQISEWLEGDPAGNHATPTPRDTPRPAPSGPSDLPLDLAALRGKLISGRELARRQREAESPDLLPTACPELDRLLAGGLPRGHLVELVGGRSSGRFALTLSLLAAVTRAGEVAAFVDLGDGLDPAAARDAGVELERLLWLRPRHLPQALLSAEILTTTGFPLVALDLGVPPVPHGRIAAPSARAAWLRLARAAGAHKTAILLSSPYRTSGSAASEVLDVRAAATRRSEPLGGGTDRRRAEEPSLFLGLEARLTLEKARRRPRSAEEGEGAVELLGLAFAGSLYRPLPRPAKTPEPALRLAASAS